MKRTTSFITVIIILSVLFTALPAGWVSGAAATIGTNLSSGPARTTVTVNGTGFTPDISYRVKFDGTDIDYGTGTVSSGGSLNSVVALPPAVRGEHSITVTTASETSNAVPFNVMPVIYEGHQFGEIGTSLLINGYGFNANTAIAVSFDGAVIDEAATDPTGSFQVIFYVPQTNLGIHTIRAWDAVGEAPPLGFAVTNPEFSLSGLGTATIDGVFSPGEWDSAGSIDMPVYVPEGGSTTGTLFAMNNQNNLYLAVRVPRPNLFPLSQVFFEFDNDGDGTWPEDGDDELLLNNYGFRDNFRLSNGNSEFDTAPSAGPPGTLDGQGAFANDGQFTTFELSHPLDSADDSHDFSLTAGSQVIFSLGLNIDWGQMTQFSGKAFVVDGSASRNYVSVSYWHQYSHSFSGDNLSNDQIVGTESWLTNCWNDNDSSDAAVSSPQITLYTSEAFNSISPAPDLSSFPPYRWSFADIPEDRGAMPTLARNNRSFMPGFEVSRSVTPYHLTVNSKQYLTVTVTPREVASQLMIDVNGGHTPYLTALITDVSAGDSTVYISGDKSYAWISVSFPTKDTPYEFSVEIDSSLNSGVSSAYFMPRVNIRLQNTTADRSEASGCNFVHDVPGLGSWIWSGTGSYSWSSQDEYVRSIELQARSTSSIPATLSLVVPPVTALSVDNNLATQPVVHVTDQFANPLSGIAVTASCSSGTGVLRGTLTVTSNSTGLAAFTDLGYDKSGETFKIKFTAGTLNVESASLTPLSAGAANKVRVETAANGSGIVVPAQTLNFGGRLTVYSITRDQFDNFVANAPASAWSLATKTPGVADTDLVGAANSPSAVFTAHNAGTGVIRATIGSLTSVNSGVITVTNPPPPPPPPVEEPPAGGGSSGGSGDKVFLSQYMTGVPGTFSSEFNTKTWDGILRLTFPKGTFGKTADGALSYIVLNPIAKDKQDLPSPDKGNIIGLTYKLEPEGTIFSPPATITLLYSDAVVPAGVNEKDLVIGYWNAAKSQWEGLAGCVVDTANNQITAPLTHFSTYAVVYLAPKASPASFSLSNLRVSPSSVKAGETVSISIPVTNNGGSAGKYILTLKINNAQVETREVDLGPGASQAISFSVKRDTAGEYTIDINGIGGKFQVAAPSPAATTTTPPQITSPAQVVSPTQVAVEKPIVTSSPVLTIPAPATPEKEKSTNTFTWIIPGIVLLTALIIGSVIVLIRRKKN
jgi:hypothetical protein